MGVEIAFGFLAVTATIAIEGLIAGVVERSLAWVDCHLAVGLRASGRIPDGDPLGIAVEPTSHNLFSFRPLQLLRQGVLRFAFITAQLFSGGSLTPNWRAARGFLDAGSGGLHGRDKRSGRREPMARTC